MRVQNLAIGISIVVHIGIAGAVAAIPKRMTMRSTTVMVTSSEKKKKEKKQDEDKKPPKPIEAPEPLLKAPRPARAEAPKPANTPPPDVAPAQPVANHSAMAALPDFGLSMGGGVGVGGIAIPTGGGGSAEPGARVGGGGAEKTLKGTAARPKETGAAADCDEPAVKPKALGAVQPQYTDDARSAGIEGRVRLALTIDSAGAVTDARVTTGLGHGLDQSALTAARRMKFQAGTRCGKPVESTFVISMRFALGE